MESRNYHDGRADEYVQYLELLSRQDPCLQRVLKFIGEAPRKLQHSFNETFFRGLIVSRVGDAGATIELSDDWDGNLDPGESSHRFATKNDFYASEQPVSSVVIVQNVQPLGVKLLGSLFHLDPISFEHFLNREASFETFDSSVLVFDYPETFIHDSGLEEKSIGDLFWLSPSTGRGVLNRVWRSVYSYSQRIVWTKNRNPRLSADIHIVFVDSFPKPRSSMCHLGQESASFDDFIRSRSLGQKVPDSLIDLGTMIQQHFGVPRPTAATTPVGYGVLEYVSRKWRVLLYQAQVKISESKAPLSGDLPLIAEVIQRKHDFEKLQRTMAAVEGSARRIPGLQANDVAVQQLKSCEAVIAGWASQLEKVATSMLGMLAIAESRKATVQAARVENLTILAFVFIPISTVSTIFGMNTEELVQNSPPMWMFAVAAGTVTASAATAAWLLYLLRSRIQGSPKRMSIKTSSDDISNPARVSSIQTHQISRPVLGRPLPAEPSTFAPDSMQTIHRHMADTNQPKIPSLNDRRQAIIVARVDEENPSTDTRTEQVTGKILGRVVGSTVGRAAACIVM